MISSEYRDVHFRDFFLIFFLFVRSRKFKPNWLSIWLVSEKSFKMKIYFRGFDWFLGNLQSRFLAFLGTSEACQVWPNRFIKNNFFESFLEGIFGVSSWVVYLSLDPILKYVPSELCSYHQNSVRVYNDSNFVDLKMINYRF